MNETGPYPISRISAEDTRIELNCRPVKAVMLYFEERYGRAELEKFILGMNMNMDYLEDRNNWISFDWYCRLLGKLVEYTGDAKAPFDAGTYAAKRECYGTLEKFYLRLLSPGSTYRALVENSHRCAKIARWEITDLKSNSCVITIKYSGEYRQDKNNCLNLRGILASVPTEWGLPPAKVKHNVCAVQGAEACVYQVSWRNRPFHLGGLLGFLAGALILLAADIFYGISIGYFMLFLVPVVGYFAGRTLDYKAALRQSQELTEERNKGLEESIRTIEKLNIGLQEKVMQRTEELNESNMKLQKTMEDLKTSQKQLIQSEKMASVGRLAAGMAHELNNPVGAVRNYLQDVLEDTPQDDPRWERMKKAENATGRCKRIVSDLLTFSRESTDLSLTDINEIIENTVSVARKENGNPDIVISAELEPGIPKIECDGMQLQQVFMNIIMNAMDAIKGKGSIFIKSYKTGERILVEISDTGEGIPDDIQDKIFDPFFTTKSPGKGMGLGLAISYNIIKRFNGEINIRSKEGEGAVFTVSLPSE
ncbi:MAG: ATP-binding protein [Candidatus Omnitrophota bacterium]